MDNCGGGQRLPPDGDEFPAAYQEFTDPDQYQFVANTNIATMASNGNLICKNQIYVASESFQVHPKSSKENPTNEKIQVTSQCIVDHIKNPLSSLVASKNHSKCDSKYSLISEKKIEIAGFYSKQVLSVTPSNSIETSPPLPLSEPPKIDSVNNDSSKNTPQQVSRKYSLNSELRRQDDKSERSVRDKIAMFSSQSNLEAPLFPNTTSATSLGSNNNNNNRRLSKYKSSDDVFTEDKVNHNQKDFIKSHLSTVERAQSSFDLSSSLSQSASTSGKPLKQHPSLPKGSPPSESEFVYSKSAAIISPQQKSLTSSEVKVPFLPTNIFGAKLYSSPVLDSGSSSKSFDTNCLGNYTFKSTSPVTLTRATSFSGESFFSHQRPQTSSEVLATTSQISRTNSLASTFRKPSEDMRRNSLNQLIEQRRKGISKLRGLIIPEKDTILVDQPITDLPEIKSKDSILLNQVSKPSIQDKWGSQNSLTSTVTVSKTTTPFKMSAPQIISKYSPAFKRKSLAVYNTSSSITTTTTTTTTNPPNSMPSSLINSHSNSNSSISSTSVNSHSQKMNQVINSTPGIVSDAPKSLESICSPTRSDYSFDYLSSTGSPENLRSRPRVGQRNYDDSDNDSAVSSSQSSISRGFSPPMSPVPSEKSNMTPNRSYMPSETSYQRRTLFLDTPTKNQSSLITEGSCYSSKLNSIVDRTFVEKSTIARSLTESNKESQIPQRYNLKRTNNNDIDCSGSSILNSISQTSAETSLRVLKPQSVEAINRKNILASAKCRSGRDLNGSPLIQRKFSDDEDLLPMRKENDDYQNEQHQKTNGNVNVNGGEQQEVKIAYIEVASELLDDEKPLLQKQLEEPALPPKQSIPEPTVARPPKSENLEPSHDLKMWVRTEARNLAEKSLHEEGSWSIGSHDVVNPSVKIKSTKNSYFFSTFDESTNNNLIGSKSRNLDAVSNGVEKKNKPGKIITTQKDERNNPSTVILSTNVKNRSATNVKEDSYRKSRRQMSLEDILICKPEPKSTRNQNITMEPNFERDGVHSGTLKIQTESRGNKQVLNKSKIADNIEEISDAVEKRKSSNLKIPTSRSLSRRSASVTDMKKVFDKADANSLSGTSSLGNTLQSGNNVHNRFPSLDSSVEESIRSSSTENDIAERFYGEQFGSISSLASSTSLISQQELAQLVEEATSEEARGSHDVIVVLLHKENPAGSVGITLAGGVDCEVKEITVHRVLSHSIADKDGRVQKGDRILSINGRSTRGLSHRESLAVLKQPRAELVLVVSRARFDDGCKLRTRAESVETIVEGYEMNGGVENTAWGPPTTIKIYKNGAGLGFSLEGGKDGPLGDKPLIVKKIFTGGAAEKTGALKAGDQLLEVNGHDVTRMSRIETWSLMKKLQDGDVNLLVRHPATKSS